MKHEKWWIVSLAAALSSMLLCALALLLPAGIGIAILAIGLTVFLLVLFQNPAYFYRRVGAMIAGAWLANTACVQLTVQIPLPNNALVEVIRTESGWEFSLVAWAMFLMCILADCVFNFQVHRTNRDQSMNRGQPEARRPKSANPGSAAVNSRVISEVLAVYKSDLDGDELEELRELKYSIARRFTKGTGISQLARVGPWGDISKSQRLLIVNEVLSQLRQIVEMRIDANKFAGDSLRQFHDRFLP